MRFENNIKPIAVNENIKDQNPNILVTFTPSKNKHTGDQGYHHLIASAVFIFKEDLDLIKSHFKNLYHYKDLSHLQNLVFFRIVKDFSITFKDNPDIKLEQHKVQLSTNPRVTLIAMSTSAFQKDMNNFNIFKDVKSTYYDRFNRNNLIFLFEDMEWSEIVELFRQKKTIISGGSKAKRHLLNPAKLRLAEFIYGIFNTQQHNLVVKSYHSDKRLKKSKIRPIKNRLKLPEKREYSTSSLVKQTNSFETCTIK